MNIQAVVATEQITDVNGGSFPTNTHWLFGTKGKAIFVRGEEKEEKKQWRIDAHEQPFVHYQVGVAATWTGGVAAGVRFWTVPGVVFRRKGKELLLARDGERLSPVLADWNNARRNEAAAGMIEICF